MDTSNSCHIARLRLLGEFIWFKRTRWTCRGGFSSFENGCHFSEVIAAPSNMTACAFRLKNPFSYSPRRNWVMITCFVTKYNNCLMDQKRSDVGNWHGISDSHQIFKFKPSPWSILRNLVVGFTCLSHASATSEIGFCNALYRNCILCNQRRYSETS